MASTITAPDLDAGHLPGSRGYNRVVIALFAAGLATFELLYSTQAILPELATRFDVTSTDTTLTLSLTTASLAVALLVAGPLSDVVGRTRLIHLSMALSVLCAVGCALAPTWPVLLVLRCLMGVSLAGLPAVATAYLREELHPSTQARAAGLYIGGTALGGMAGRLVTGFTAELAGWRWSLASAALLALACAVVVRRTLPDSQHFTPAPTGVRTMLAMARRAVSDRTLVGLYVIGGCSVGAMVAMLNVVGFRLEAPPFGLGLGAASLVFLVYPLGTVSAASFGRLADRLGRRAVLPVGAGVAVAGALLTFSEWLPLVIAGLGLLVIGFFAVHGVASGWVPARAHAGGVSAGQAASLYTFTYYVGSSVFGSLGATAWAGAGWPGVVGVSATLMCVTGAVALRLRTTRSLLA
ncbi:MFS transporter [Nocardioides currus]|uniref:MFS transporter n=1 Tax=Nocardioides currus TaxID=2133958 RepID=A0A2R7YU41_9ACTN|nr:MFS transporter [Nocardioides currus]PUA79399.1 MFS transporter [Nocardioides currus]